MKLKALKPTLREKKRYVMFEVISNKSFDANIINKSIEDSLLSYVGTKGLSDAGLIFLTDKFNKTSQTGILRVSHKSVDNLKSCFCLLNQINNTPVLIRSKDVSGILKKVQRRR